MKNKKNIMLPALDLSSYNTVESLPITVCDIIVSGLVSYKGNSKKVAKRFNIYVDKVNEVYLLQYLAIKRAIELQSRANDIDGAIYSCLDLLTDHIDQIKSDKKKGDNKVMTTNLTRNVNSVVDRLVKIKDSDNAVYNSTISRLYDNINRIKVAEHNNITSETEPGANIAVDNQSEYLSKLQDYAKARTGVARPVVGYNVDDNTVLHWPTVSDTALYFSSGNQTISDHCKSKTKITFRNGKGTWTFAYEE